MHFKIKYTVLCTLGETRMLMHFQVGDKKVNCGLCRIPKLYSPCIQSFEKGELCLEDQSFAVVA